MCASDRRGIARLCALCALLIGEYQEIWKYQGLERPGFIGVFVGYVVRKEGLEPSRCYPQVPETCASTSSATFAEGGS